MKRLPLPTVPCPHCIDGEIPGPKAGEVLRREREERDVPRSNSANPEISLCHHLNLSETYAVALERGERPLTWELVRRYREAIEVAVKARLEVEN